MGRFVFIGLDLYSWLNQASEPKLILAVRGHANGTMLTGRAIPGFGFLLAVLAVFCLLLPGLIFLLVWLLAPAPPNTASPQTYIAVKWGLAFMLIALIALIAWLHLSERREDAYAEMIDKVQKLLKANQL